MNPAAVAFDRLAREILAGLVALKQPEDRIAELLADGLTAREIAARLGVPLSACYRLQKGMRA